MEAITIDILSKLGISGIPAVIIYLLINRSTEHRKEARDGQIQTLEDRIETCKQSLTKHISHHQDYEKSICHKIDKINERFDRLDDRLNPIANAVSSIQGYMEGKFDRRDDYGFENKGNIRK